MLSLKYQDKYDKRYMELLADKSIPKHKLFEYLCALELGHISWDDLPPDFEDHFDLPHTRDYGVDTINLEYTQTGQAKLYNEKSTIKWADMTNFRTYSVDLLNIGDMVLFTTNNSKIDSLVNKLINDGKLKLRRGSYDELMNKWRKTPVNIQPTKDKQLIIEERSYLLKCHNIITGSTKKILKCQLPCGTGKTYIMIFTIIECLKLNNINNIDKFIIFCPWKDLAYQTYNTCKNFNLKVGFIGDGKLLITDNTNVIVCINESIDNIPNIKFKYKIIDEAHHIEQSDSKIREKMNKIKCEKEIEFSATFKSQHSLDFDYSIEEAENDGYITPYKLHIEYFTQGDRMNGLLDILCEKAEWFPTLIYFNSTKRAKEFCDRLNTRKICSDYIIAKTNAKKRKEIYESLKNGEVKIVCLCGCWNEAISIDEVQSVIFGDLRHSDINKIQIAMRGNRLHKNKPFFRIVLPIIKDNLNEKDIKKLLNSFSERDNRIKKAIENRSVSRIKININSDEPIVDAEFLYEEVYNRINGMLLMSQEDKVNLILKYLDTNKQLPSKNESFNDGVNMRSFWITNRTKKKLIDIEPHNKLLTNPILKNDYENYWNDKKRYKITLTIEQKVDIFLTYFEANNNILPKVSDNQKFQDGTDMRSFWQVVVSNKKGMNLPYNKLLQNPILKKKYDEYWVEKELTKNKIKLSVEEKVIEMLEKVKLTGIKFNNIQFSDKSNMNCFWSHAKERQYCIKVHYNKLLTNPILKNDYEKYHINKEKNKDKIKLTIEQKVDIFLTYFEANNNILPKVSENQKFQDGTDIRSFWQVVVSRKKGMNLPYNKLLQNPILKKKYDEYWIHKELTKNKIKLSKEEKTCELLEYIKNFNKSPPENGIQFSNGKNLGQFWKSIKMKGINNNIILLENPILKKNYNDYLITKASNENKNYITTDAKISELLDWVNKYDSLPPQNPLNTDSLFSDGVKMGGFWCKCKEKKLCSEESHNKLLENVILKNDYEKFQINKQQNKTNIKLTSKQKINEFIKVIDNYSDFPSFYILNNLKFSDDSKIYMWWSNLKFRKYCSKKPYIKLLEIEKIKEKYLDIKPNCSKHDY